MFFVLVRRTAASGYKNIQRNKDPGANARWKRLASGSLFGGGDDPHVHRVSTFAAPVSVPLRSSSTRIVFAAWCGHFSDLIISTCRLPPVQATIAPLRAACETPPRSSCRKFSLTRSINDSGSAEQLIARTGHPAARRNLSPFALHFLFEPVSRPVINNTEPARRRHLPILITPAWALKRPHRSPQPARVSPQLLCQHTIFAAHLALAHCPVPTRAAQQPVPLVAFRCNQNASRLDPPPPARSSLLAFPVMMIVGTSANSAPAGPAGPIHSCPAIPHRHHCIRLVAAESAIASSAFSDAQNLVPQRCRTMAHILCARFSPSSQRSVAVLRSAKIHRRAPARFSSTIR